MILFSVSLGLDLGALTGVMFTLRIARKARRDRATANEALAMAQLLVRRTRAWQAVEAHAREN